MSRNAARTLLILLLALWAGLVTGVSFIATPAKFLAQSLPLPTALDVGRQTFRVLGRVELVIACIAVLLCLRSRAGFLALCGISALCILLIVQRFWLLPLLDHRVSIYLSGGVPDSSSLHAVFIAFEALKVMVALLCAAGAMAPLNQRQ